MVKGMGKIKRKNNLINDEGGVIAVNGWIKSLFRIINVCLCGIGGR